MPSRGNPAGPLGRARRGGLAAALLLLVDVFVGCGTTVDSVGYNSGPAGIVLHPLVGPASYPNPFKDLLGKTDADIANKIAATFAQLFHGDPNMMQPIYFPVNTDEAQILDVFHDNDVRSEGIGWGMIIAVELDKADEFDRLWRFAKNMLEDTASTSPSRGYFNSSCDTESGTAPCIDPFGMEQFLTALLFAKDRWGVAGAIDYGTDAIALLDVMRHKQDQNGGIVDSVTDVFDPDTGLAFDFPSVTAAGRTRPSIEMPAYYELWAQATGDAFWSRAARGARAHWKLAADPDTGLLPVRATFDGASITGSGDTYQPEAYRAQINMALDTIWFGTDHWEIDEANQLLGFFSGQGIDTYASAFSLDGKVLTAAHDVSLVAVNGMTAAISTNADRAAYVDKVWNLTTPVGVVRYYQGILDLLSLLVLSGQYRVW